MTLAEKITAFIKKEYGCEAECPGKRFTGRLVFRHKDNKKPFAALCVLPRGTERTEALNVKTGDPLLADLFCSKKGYSRGCPSGVDIALDGSVPFKEIAERIRESYFVTASSKTRLALRPAKEWIIPANPEYFDIVHAFDAASVIRWKQGAGIKTGDTVFMYVGAPVSAVLYKCTVTETDIPVMRLHTKIRLPSLMNIRLERRYAPKEFPFERLKTDFGVFAVRGPRGIPLSLSEALNAPGE